MVELSRHQRSGTARRSLADAQPSLMGELKASRLSFYVAHASFHITHTDTVVRVCQWLWAVGANPELWQRQAQCVWVCVWYTLLTDKRHSVVSKGAGLVRAAPGRSFAWKFLAAGFKAAVRVMLLCVNARTKVFIYLFITSWVCNFSKHPPIRNVCLHIRKRM